MTNSRAEILAKVLKNQPEPSLLPADLVTVTHYDNPIDNFKTILSNIGGSAVNVPDYQGIQDYIKIHFPDQRIVSTLPELSAVSEQGWENQDPHSYENVDLAVIRAHFGVAENAALWITEDLMHQRAVPFICQQLAVVINAKDIVETLHDAYVNIADSVYGFGTFIAGPSKTADIEQSLVLGAHGPKGMTVFILD